MTKIEIHSEYITVAQFLKFSGAVMSGGEAKEYILNGNVKLNGEVCEMRGKKLHGGEIISLCGEEYEVVKSCT
ncbi:MAG: RNA-binding S4 domain-containing protein [Oscillospiraceae bacterium]